MIEGYKKTAYGKIPVEWDFVKLNTVFNRITTKNKECNKNVLTISARKGLINQEEFFNKTVASKDNSNYYLLEKGDFAYNKSYSTGYPMGAIKKLEYYDKGIVSPLYICFRLVDEKSDKEFYKYFFEHNIFDKAISSIAQEGARNHGLLNVSVSEFFDLPILRPPLKEQQKIAEILSTVDSQIDDTDKLIEKTKELKKGLMQRLLTKGIGHKEFKMTEVGEIPVEWELRKLENLGSTFAGLSGKTKDDFGKGKQYIPYKNIFNNSKIDIEYLEYVEVSDDENQNKVKMGDVFFTTSSETAEEVGMSSVLLNEVDDVYLNSFCFGYRLNEFEKVLPEFLRFLLRGNYVRKYITKLAQGSTRFNLSKNVILNMAIPVPSLKEQKQIAKILSGVDVQIEEYQNKKVKLEELKKGLMQQLLTGKIRVNLGI